MSNLLSKLTNLVVNKITEEGLISGDSESGSPVIIVVDKDNDITYNSENYDIVEVFLSKNNIEYAYICVSESYLSELNKQMVALGQSSNSLDSGNYAIKIIGFQNMNGESEEFNFYGEKLLTYQGEESITIEYESDGSGAR